MESLDQVARWKKWQSMIAACAAKGHDREALQAYERMRQDDRDPGSMGGPEEEEQRHLFVRLVGCCGSLRDEAQGRRLHADIVSRKLDSDLRVATALVGMYGKLGRADTAREVFDGIRRKDVVCWNAMLAVYARSDAPGTALELYAAGIGVLEPNSVTYASVLAACSRCKDLEQGRAIHSRIASSSRNLRGATLVCNALVSMYAACGRLDSARMVFESIPSKNVVSWNSMIAAYARNGDFDQALEMYSRMVSSVEPDAVTFSIVLGACSKLESQEALQHGRAIHARIRSSKLDSFVQVALVNMYAKCGDLEAAKLVFDASPDKRKNIVVWNVMIVAYSRWGCHREALELYTRLEIEGLEPDEVSVATAVSCCSALGFLEPGEWIISTAPKELLSSLVVQNAAVNLYAKCGELGAAHAVFDGIKHKNVVSWTGIIGGYAQHGHPGTALSLYRKMNLEGVRPNEATLATVLGACSSEEFLREGMQIHSSLVGGDFQSAPVVDTAAITMYGSCGRADLARRVLDEHSVVGGGGGACVAAWNAMIGAYAQLGHAEEALDLYRRMSVEQDAQPNDRTLSTLLSACDLESGKRIHDTILQAKANKPGRVVQTALLNMYGKCGSLEMARRIFDEIQHKDVVCWNAMIAAAAQCGDPHASLRLYSRMSNEGVKAETSTFVSVLGACSSLGDLKAGEAVHSHTASSNLDSLAPVAVALVNMYAKCGRVELARGIFAERLGDSRNSVAWNSMLSLYAHHGHGVEALELFKDMVSKGVKVSEASVTSVLVGCSHSGLHPLGRSILINTADDHGVAPCVDHFVCMVDLLARGGMLEDAEELIRTMPCHPPAAAWISLLGGCRDHGDFARGVRAAHQVFVLDPHSTVPYNLLVVPSSKSGVLEGDRDETARPRAFAVRGHL